MWLKGGFYFPVMMLFALFLGSCGEKDDVPRQAGKGKFILNLRVSDTLGNPVQNVAISVEGTTLSSDRQGALQLNLQASPGEELYLKLEDNHYLALAGFAPITYMGISPVNREVFIARKSGSALQGSFTPDKNNAANGLPIASPRPQGASGNMAQPGNLPVSPPVKRSSSAIHLNIRTTRPDLRTQFALMVGTQKVGMVSPGINAIPLAPSLNGKAARLTAPYYQDTHFSLLIGEQIDLSPDLRYGLVKIADQKHGKEINLSGVKILAAGQVVGSTNHKGEAELLIPYPGSVDYTFEKEGKYRAQTFSLNLDQGPDEVTLIPNPPGVKIRLLGSKGNALAKQSVILNGGGLYLTAVSDKNGNVNFEHETLRANEAYSLTLEKEGYSQEITFSENQVNGSGFDLPLDVGFAWTVTCLDDPSVRLKVLDSNGRLLAENSGTLNMVLKAGVYQAIATIAGGQQKQTFRASDNPKEIRFSTEDGLILYQNWAVGYSGENIPPDNILTALESITSDQGERFLKAQSILGNANNSRENWEGSFNTYRKLFEWDPSLKTRRPDLLTLYAQSMVFYSESLSEPENRNLLLTARGFCNLARQKLSLLTRDRQRWGSMQLYFQGEIAFRLFQLDLKNQDRDEARNNARDARDYLNDFREEYGLFPPDLQKSLNKAYLRAEDLLKELNTRIGSL